MLIKKTLVRFAAGEDYVATSVTLTFQATETSQVVMVPTLADNILEGVEYLTAELSLSAGQTGVVLDADVAVVEIIDDDCESFYAPDNYHISSIRCCGYYFFTDPFVQLLFECRI